MSDENQETQTDKELNFAKVNEELKQAKARIAELSPLAVEKAVREAGFAPDTPEGKALSRLAGDNADTESVRNLAVELGFEASTQEQKHEPTPNERAAQEFADRQSALNSVTQPDNPPTFADNIAELNGLIATAKAAGNHPEVRRLNQQLIALNNQLLARQMAEKARA